MKLICLHWNATFRSSKRLRCCPFIIIILVSAILSSSVVAYPGGSWMPYALSS